MYRLRKIIYSAMMLSWLTEAIRCNYMIRFVFLLLSFILSATAAAFQNEPEGFRGLLWASPIEAVADEMEVVQKSGETAMYRRVGDRMQLGDVTLRDLRYVYFRGRLSGVTMSTEGVENREAIIRVFSAQYGPGRQSNRYINNFVWLGGGATVGLLCGTGSTCTGILQSRKMQMEEDAAKRAAADRAKADF
jgi:hypothetical protein